MTLADAASLLSRLETIGIPIGFALLTILLQTVFATFSARTLGADLAAAAASLHISVVVTRLNVVESVGASGVVSLIALLLGLLWCVCLRLAGPFSSGMPRPLMSEPKAGARHVASFLLGLLALYGASWVAVALQTAQASAKVTP